VPPLSPSAQRVQDALAARGLPHEVVELPQTTRSAAEAAQAIGCRVEQIAKSLVFKGARSSRPLLVIASGSNRVNERRIAEYVGEPVERAAADFVREQTGYAIGGVPPLAHRQPLEVLVDEHLQRCAEIWAAAGTPHAVFRLTPNDLLLLTGGRVVAIT